MDSKKLMPLFWAAIVLEIIIIVMYETELVLEGCYAGNNTAEFLCATTMEIATICLIPLALRLFKFEFVSKDIKANGVKGHYRWALIRMAMLILPMIINTMLYYLFIKVEFAYMAIILAISLVFIIPTKARCESEL